MSGASCPLCAPCPEDVLWSDSRCLVVARPMAGTRGLCRVVWRSHVPEMTDLTNGERAHLMAVVYATEAALRAQAAPVKINLASLGNIVPHLHWHVIPRYSDDAFFPDPVWATARRAAWAPAALPWAAIGAHIGRQLTAPPPAVP